MRSIRLVFVLMLVTFTFANAEEKFFLRAGGSERLGPFVFRKGESVTIGRERYKLRIPDSIEHVTLQKMRSIILPAVEFESAGVSDVVKYLSEQGAANDKGGKGVRFQTGMFSGKLEEVPPISFKAGRISLLDALRIFTEITNLQYTIAETGAVIIHRPDELVAEPIEKSYDMFWDISSSIANSNWDSSSAPISGGIFGGALTATGLSREKQFEGFFAQFGVPWPKNTSLTYIPSLGRLTAVNSKENMALFEEVMEMFNVKPYQIEIGVQFVEFDRTDIEQLSTNGCVSPSAVSALRANGKGRILASPRVLTKSGQQAAIKGVKELVYPTAFEVTGQIFTNANGAVLHEGFAVQQEGFETRECGVLLEVLPEASIEDGLINLTMSPQTVSEPEWRDYGFEYNTPKGRKMAVKMEQPFVSVVTATTSVSIKNGATVLLGGGVPGTNRDGLVYLFASARLVGLDGQPIPEKKEYKSTVGKEVFFLVPQKGREIGPIAYRNGTAVATVSGTDYRLEMDSDAGSLMSRMSEIIIPSFECHNMSMEELTRVLSAKTVNPFAAGMRDQKPGVDIIFKPGVAGTQQIPTVSFTSEETSLLNLLESVVKITGTRIRPRNGVVMVEPESDPDLPVLHRAYRAYSYFKFRDGGPTLYADGTDFKEFLSDFGVTWPSGSSVKSLYGCSMIVVANTEENLDLISKIMSLCNCVSSQVDVETQFIQFDSADVESVTVDGFVDQKLLMELFRKGRGKLLAAPRIITKSGQQATVKGVKEIIYPTDFEPITLNRSSNSNDAADYVSSFLEPGGFQTREVGVLFEILPEISTEGWLINFCGTPQIVFDPEWKDFGADFVDMNALLQRSRMDAPFFHVASVTSSISARNGEPILFGGGMPGKEKGKLVFAFTTATLIGVDGSTVERE